ncbi:hypothetical protein [Kribbella speibonae]|uniref:Uncharacterized protein n=1 Tax=Kribbella speibonae TaxID=1572660 RepID=A0A4R0IFD9_9ACTN|nr:hypothetical protein [Kribbella speibonae]TCC31981.1 hypothetical protein E0H92_36345 [Kribbella speibonae]
MTALVFPIGHYNGIREQEQVVRVGWRQHRIDADAFAVWVLAHGLPEVGKGAWTVDDVVVHAQRAGIAEAAAYVERLAGAGLLAVVDEGRTFAQHHRLDVMFVGLGNAPDRLEGHAVGIPGLGTAAILDPDCYELWQWGSVAPTLWHSCEVRATVTAEPSGQPDPDAALAEILGDLRFLVARGCAYLDVAG